ncbi:hypothetical protein RJ639_036911 [Escallonia herrerae]|uniref:Uncharacterized protein n=1 Tax=Escallonia herrerae TaxID=1293975 RepID=A0AA88WQ57_9ASTE|nr:hypothetical protein RJ639_036911 [Escallonia herrerae]
MRKRRLEEDELGEAFLTDRADSVTEVGVINGYNCAHQCRHLLVFHIRPSYFRVQQVAVTGLGARDGVDNGYRWDRLLTGGGEGGCGWVSSAAYGCGWVGSAATKFAPHHRKPFMEADSMIYALEAYYIRDDILVGVNSCILHLVVLFAVSLKLYLMCNSATVQGSQFQASRNYSLGCINGACQIPGNIPQPYISGSHIKIHEKNCRKGRFCPSKLKGRRAIELGAGCGVAGFGMALLGCDVVSTDQTELLECFSYLSQFSPNHDCSDTMRIVFLLDSLGSISVAELNWGDECHIKALEPPFDYIVGTDVASSLKLKEYGNMTGNYNTYIGFGLSADKAPMVYAEHLLEPLLQTMLALSGPKATILVIYCDPYPLMQDLSSLFFLYAIPYGHPGMLPMTICRWAMRSVLQMFMNNA